MDDDQYIILNNHSKTANELAAALGRTRYAVVSRIRLLRGDGRLPPKNKWFSAEEDFYIRLSDEPLKTIAAKLGRQWRDIGQRRKQLGIAKKYKKRGLP